MILAMPRYALLASLLLFPLLSACGDAPPEDGSPFGADVDPTALTYAPELGVDFDTMERTDAGVYWRDDRVGEGEEAVAGSAASVHYTGYLPDGQSFDSSRPRGEPFLVQLGAGQVIPGWDDGVPGMREGGRRTLVIPSEMAYGSAGAGGVIPPYAVLVFEVEMVDVH
jgi:FKBP-type peptidyl-prolyl cis-trans isomerase FkpA